MTAIEIVSHNSSVSAAGKMAGLKTCLVGGGSKPFLETAKSKISRLIINNTAINEINAQILLGLNWYSIV